MSYPLFASLGSIIQGVALVLDIVLALTALATVVALAILPGKIAKWRKHPQAMAVNVCGVLGLPTGIMWVVAMAWAFWRYPAAGDVASHDLAALKKQLDGLESVVALLEKQKKGAAR